MVPDTHPRRLYRTRHGIYAGVVSNVFYILAALAMGCFWYYNSDEEVPLPPGALLFAGVAIALCLLLLTGAGYCLLARRPTSTTRNGVLLVLSAFIWAVPLFNCVLCSVSGGADNSPLVPLFLSSVAVILAFLRRPLDIIRFALIIFAMYALSGCWERNWLSALSPGFLTVLKYITVGASILIAAFVTLRATHNKE
ncbi:MAG: hypothetical protein KAS72_04205 [Phycisphaerales bacterium]|nr:hypothetical protein [Phycisphaerales bacterium]